MLGINCYKRLISCVVPEGPAQELLGSDAVVPEGMWLFPTFTYLFGCVL